MIVRGRWEIRPLRLLYYICCMAAAWHYYGAGAACLVGIMPLDIKWGGNEW